MWLPVSAVGLAVAVRRGRASLSRLFGALLTAGIALCWWGGAVDLVTIAWTIFSALMALALFAPLHNWSLFTNFLNYGLVLLLFVIEYQLRLYCLPSHEHLSFRAFCRLLACTDLRTLAR